MCLYEHLFQFLRRISYVSLGLSVYVFIFFYMCNFLYGFVFMCFYGFECCLSLGLCLFHFLLCLFLFGIHHSFL